MNAHQNIEPPRALSLHQKRHCPSPVPARLRVLRVFWHAETTLGQYSISGRLETRAAAGKKGAHSKMSHTAVELQCFALEFVLRNVPYMVHLGAPVKKPNRRKAVPGSSAEDPNKRGKRVPVIFFRTEAAREPVRDWLKALPIPMIGSESERTSRRLNSAGLSECQSAGLWARGSTRSAPISRATGLPAFCSTSIARAEWSCYTAS